MAFFAAPASAAVVALSGFRAAGTPVLDRGHVYWLQESRAGRVVLRRASIAGRSVQRVGTFSAERSEWHYWKLLVSGRQVGVLEQLPGDLHQDSLYVLRYGPLGGPYATKRFSNGERAQYLGGPYLVDAGVGLLADEPRALDIESPAGQRSLALPQGSSYTARAGRIAIAQSDRVVVVDTGDGSIVRSLSLPQRPMGASAELRLDSDGGVVIQFVDGDERPLSTLYAAADETALRRVNVPEVISAFTAGKVAGIDIDGDAQYALVRDLRSGGKTVFRGPPSIEIEGLSVAGGSVAWTAGVCQFVASFRPAVVRRVPAGPCARTVTTLHMSKPAENMARDQVSARVGCLTSDRSACLISLQMLLPGSPAFALRAALRVGVGRSRTIRMHLPPVITRCARAFGWGLDALGIDADGGRHGHFYDSYGDPPSTLENAGLISPGGVRRCRNARSYLRRR